jgi:hypothetical protein
VSTPAADASGVGSDPTPEQSNPFRLCRKPLLSLDTNYLSNLARARLGEGLAGHVLEAWRELLAALVEGVWEDRLVCPAFNVQVEELAMDDRISGPAWTVLRSLSLGLAFYSLDGIVARQVGHVAAGFLGCEASDGPAWRTALQEDPDVPAVELSRRARGRGFPFPLSDRQEVERRRHAQGGFGLCGDLPASVREAILCGSATDGRLAFAQLIIGRRMRDAFTSQGVTGAPWPLDGGTAEWSGLVARLRQVGMGLRDFISFLESPWPAHVPFVDLYCSLARASALEGAAGRPDRASDEADRCIVSALLPYCALVTTDRFVKHVVTTELHLDMRYGCQVFSGRVEDVQLLAELVKALPVVTT